MALEKMTFTAYEDSNFKKKYGNTLTVWINPASYTRTQCINLNNTIEQGDSGASPNFASIGNEEISFDLTFDATGVIPSPIAGETATPADGIVGPLTAFRRLVFKYNGDIHRPNFVMISWAQLQFQGILKSLSVTYTLFMPNGTPLRAKAAVVFNDFTDRIRLEKEAGKNSPDMSHLVTVKAGDTLPQLCHRIYGSSLLYLQIAEINDLINFRRLEPGTQLVFPPISGGA